MPHKHAGPRGFLQQISQPHQGREVKDNQHHEQLLQQQQE